MGRGWAGSVAAIIGAWAPLPWIILMAGIGALLGAIIGVVSGTAVGPGVTERLDVLTGYVFPLPVPLEDLVATPAIQLGGIIGGMWGAASGAWTLGWIAFAYPWELLYSSDPLWPVLAFLGQAITAFAVAAVYTSTRVAAEDKEIRFVGGGRRMVRAERERVEPILAEVAGRMGIPADRLPKLIGMSGPQVRAFAGARSICLSEALIRQATDAELAGVIAHELAHWRHGDPVARYWQRGLAWPLYLTYNGMARMLSGSGRERYQRPLVTMLIRMVFWSVETTVRFFVIPLQGPAARRDELRADAEALAAGYGEGLYSHLERHRDFELGPKGWDEVVARTHPPMAQRLERLEDPRALHRYRLGPGAAFRSSPGSASTSTLEQE